MLNLELRWVGLIINKMNKEYTSKTKRDDEVPEDVPARSKDGDLFELGQHRVLCGDSTLSEAFLKLTGGNKADMVFTDPPSRQ